MLGSAGGGEESVAALHALAHLLLWVRIAEGVNVEVGNLKPGDEFSCTLEGGVPDEVAVPKEDDLRAEVAHRPQEGGVDAVFAEGADAVAHVPREVAIGKLAEAVIPADGTAREGATGPHAQFAISPDEEIVD